MKPRFLLDIDGVAANWLKAAIAIFRVVTGKQYAIQDFTTWDVFDVVGREHAPACNEYFHAEGFCTKLEPYPEAKAGVTRLRSLVDVVPVTSPTHSRHWYFERVEWVRQHLDHSNDDEVVFRKHKEFEFGHYLLDDRPKHVENWAVRHPEGIALLWDQPYNRGEDGMLKKAPGNARRVHSWDEVIDAVRSNERRFA